MPTAFTPQGPGTHQHHQHQQHQQHQQSRSASVVESLALLDARNDAAFVARERERQALQRKTHRMEVPAEPCQRTPSHCSCLGYL